MCQAAIAKPLLAAGLSHKLKKDWKTIKEKKEKVYCPF